MPTSLLDHATHDPELIAALAAGDVPAHAAADAQRLVAGCHDCAQLHADLLAISSAVRTLPAPANAAPRDFRLAPERAASLARGSGLRRLLRPFASRGGGLRPLAASLATLGLAGILVTVMLPSFGMTSFMAAERAGGSPTSVDDGRNGSEGIPGNGPNAGPVASPGQLDFGSGSPWYAPSGQPKDISGGGSVSAPPEQGVDGSPTRGVGGIGVASWATIASVVLLVVGVGLLVLQFAARRVR